MALKALYQLEDVNDSSGNGYTLTNNNNVTFTAAKFGNGANFGSANTTKYLYTSNNMGINGTAITMMGWIKCLAEINSGVWMFMSQSNTDSEVAYELQYNYNGGAREIDFLRTRNNVVVQGPVYNIALGTSNWYHIALTYDNTNVRGYVNGTLVTSPIAASGNGSGDYNEGFAIGRKVTGDTNYASIIADRVKVYNEALSDNAILLAYREAFRKGGFFMFF